MKEVVFWTIALTLLFFVTSHSHAVELSAKMGTSATKEASSKIFGLQYEDYLTRGFIFQIEQDLLSIPSDTYTATATGSARVGVRVDANHIYATATAGPAYISQTDRYLGGYFQFTESVSLGLQDNYGSVGIGYQHISSAGLSKPNKGRDYFFIQTGIHF